MVEPSTLGARLREARERKGLKQLAVAIRLGLTPQTISALETGKIRSLQSRHLPHLARLLGVEVGWLLGMDLDEHEVIERRSVAGTLIRARVVPAQGRSL